MPLYPQTLTDLLAKVPGGRGPIIPLSGYGHTVSVPGATPAIFATWDPGTKNAAITLSGGNLVASAGASLVGARSTVGRSSGKWYWEITITADSLSSSIIGVTDSGFINTTYPGNYANSIALQFGGGRINTGWTVGASGIPSFGVGSVVMFAIDATAGNLWWGVNGTWVNNSPSGAADYTITPGSTLYAATDPYSGTHTANFGASAFSFSVPAGFNAGLF